jgi:hypothetical protein
MDEAWDTFGGTDDHPGPIDNSSLFNGVYFRLYYLIFVREVYSINCHTEWHYLINIHNQKYSKLRMKSRLTSYPHGDENIEFSKSVIYILEFNPFHSLNSVLYFLVTGELFLLCSMNIAAKY